MPSKCPESRVLAAAVADAVQALYRGHGSRSAARNVREGHPIRHHLAQQESLETPRGVLWEIGALEDRRVERPRHASVYQDLLQAP
jgi:hypothetical protein